MLEGCDSPSSSLAIPRARQRAEDDRGRRALSLLARALPPSCVERSPLEALQRSLTVMVLRVAALAVGGAHGGPPPTALLAIRRSLDRGGQRQHGLRALRALFDDPFWRGVGLFRHGVCGSLEHLPLADGTLAALLDCLSVDEAGASWQATPIEQLGALHEGMLGLRLAVATGRSAPVGPQRRMLDLEALLARPAEARAAAVSEATGWSVAKRAATALAQASSIDELAGALCDRATAADILPAGALYLQSTSTKRRAGAHYTPLELTARVVEATLRPLLARASVLDLAICDPAMGCGAFLLESCRHLAGVLAAGGSARQVLGARSAVAQRCLHGVDADPMAVEVARTSLWLLVGGAPDDPSFLDRALRVGDALIGAAPGDVPLPAELSCLVDAVGVTPLHWPRAFPEVFATPRAGFDACIGNPPWVAYAGRAAEPLEDELFDYYLRHNPAFHGYRTLHGLFVQRAATLLRPGGRLGLIVPTSVSDLQGYAATRRAHDRLCDVDPELPDFGADAFRGVFQPAMAVLSTRRAQSQAAEPPATAAAGGAWRLSRSDLDPIGEALLARLSAMATLPANAFGERGFQSSGGDAGRLRVLAGPEAPFVLPIREGADIASFVAYPPRLYLDPTATQSRLRPPEQWREVRLLVRQTARFPIAALGDGLAFRNSILAGFSTSGLSEMTLLAWLNAAPIRWYHYMKHRDARQGMPQVKIAHLRSLPAPAAGLRDLGTVGELLGKRNRGASQPERDELDALVAELLGMNQRERRVVADWARAFPAP